MSRADAPLVRAQPSEVHVSGKATPGNYFEDLVVGREIVHATPRTITEGDAAVYLSLTSSRYPLFCDAEFARSLGFERELINDLLVFHVVFGNTVPDISPERARQPRLRRSALRRAGLSRRHHHLHEHGDRGARGEFGLAGHHLGAHHRRQPARRRGDELRALGAD